MLSFVLVIKFEWLALKYVFIKMHTLQKILKIYGIQYYEKRININNVHSSTPLNKSLFLY